MALNLIKKVTVLGQHSFLRSNFLARFSFSLYEPDYLKVPKSKFPLLSDLNIQIKGYDYPVLESYQSFVHKLANIMQFDVDDSWALPPQEFKIEKYKPESSIVISEYNLKIYERNIQISEVSAIKYQILVRALEAALPQGVTLNIDVYDPVLENKRYIPDKEILDLKSTLETMKTKKT